MTAIAKIEMAEVFGGPGRQRRAQRASYERTSCST
jgi:hypothetical protein